MGERGKQILGFLLLKPAFTGKNLFSIFLVMLFVGVYVASGGRVHSVPKIKPGGQFGAVEVNRETEPAVPAELDDSSSIFAQPKKSSSVSVEKESSKEDELSPAQRLELLREKLKQQNQTRP